jgi:hypothetical protein
MTARSAASQIASAGLLLATIVVGGSAVAPARAQESCQADFQRLTQKRMAQIGVLNRLGHSGKGKMDPLAACPVARNLTGIETEMLNYMVKNKDWCAIPDNVVDTFKQARAKTQNFATQACGVAVKIKKMQAMQAQQQRQQAANPSGAPAKLPAGPL